MLPAGSGDGFLEVQLKPEAFQAAADAAGFPVTMRMQEGYDHRCADSSIHMVFVRSEVVFGCLGASERLAGQSG
jgi:hypothetical protein